MDYSEFRKLNARQAQRALQRKEGGKENQTEGPSLEEIRMIAQELKDIGIVSYKEEEYNPEKDPDIVGVREANRIRKEIGSLSYGVVNAAKRYIKNRKLTSKSVALLLTCMNPYEDEFCIWAMDQVVDPENFLPSIKNSMRYRHQYETVAHHFNYLKSAGVFDLSENKSASEKKGSIISNKKEVAIIVLSLCLIGSLAGWFFSIIL